MNKISCEKQTPMAQGQEITSEADRPDLDPASRTLTGRFSWHKKTTKYDIYLDTCSYSQLVNFQLC